MNDKQINIYQKINELQAKQIRIKKKTGEYDLALHKEIQELMEIAYNIK